MILFRKIFLFLIFNQLVFVSCQSKKEKASIDIDLSVKPSNINSMSGFLHYQDIKTLDSDIKKLKPKYWRIGWSFNSMEEIDYMRKNNITPIMVVSDKYGYPYETHKKWEDPLKTDKLVVLLKNMYQQMGNSVIYDIWNESSFEEKEFFSIFKKAHDIIRSQPGGDKALISGPSYDKYDPKQIDRFLQFCLDNNVRLDVMSWHEWRYGDKEFQDIKKDIAELKVILSNRYAKVGVKKIILNEVVFADIQFNPTEILQTLKSLEESGIDGACKACWEESNGVSNCNNNSMDGILDQKGKPRSAWWAYKLYNLSLQNRVRAHSDESNLIPFVSYDDKNIHLIVANNSKYNINQVRISAKNLLKNKDLKKYKNFNLKVYQIPNTGENVLLEPKLLSSKQMKLTNNQLIYNLTDTGSKTLYYLVLSGK
ncbi:hypothetical protein SAMN05444409_2423 [Epilithonimonas zeae]|uniref:Beta-xylosidase n=2 Tax=Epilithonimonas zeae TaxID=1416779 RepID=A0A1N6HEY3_9FLAO|nr:hypothetical protein SAMN05444409_2423 [Epilithonimonas zeae]